MVLLILVVVSVVACILLALFVETRGTFSPNSNTGHSTSRQVAGRESGELTNASEDDLRETSLRARCPCGVWLRAPAKWAGKRGLCPYCGAEVEFPKLAENQALDAEVVEMEPANDLSSPSDAGSLGKKQSDAREIPTDTAAASSTNLNREPRDVDGKAVEATPRAVHFIDPPAEEADAPGPQWTRLMLDAVLDPRSIQWLLILGGGLMVLGLIIWLVSLGVFDDPRIVAGLLTVGSVGVVATGSALCLYTSHQTVGRALAFLGCVLVPLNLWYYRAQGIITLDQNLWIGGLGCCALYAAVMYRLRDPLFIYAVQAGVTLTTVLLMADLGWVANVSNLSLALMALGIVSIHLERSFASDAKEFSRARFGLPLFWVGHIQMAAGLIFLLTAQGLDWFLDPATRWLGIQWAGTGLAESQWLAGALWLLGGYTYLYSDIVVRRVGIYTILAAACVVMTELTLLGFNIHPEALIAVLAITGAVVSVIRTKFVGEPERYTRVLPVMALLLSGMPLVIGMALHVRATSEIAVDLGWSYLESWSFVGAMLLVVAANRLSSYLNFASHPREAAAYLFLSAGAAVIAVAGSLRLIGLETWPQQAPLLMLLPLFYLLASRWWRGFRPQHPFEWVAHATSVVILTGALNSSWEVAEAMARPVVGETTNLLLSVVFAEATLFYVLAAVFRRRSLNIYFAAIAGCAAVWQLVGYMGLPGATYIIFFGLLGLAMLIASRIMGLESRRIYRASGDESTVWQGTGTALFHCSSAMLGLAFAAAFLQGLARVAMDNGNWLTIGTLAGSSTIALASVIAAPASGIRRFFVTCCIALAGMTLLSLQAMLELSGWQQLELFCLIVGVVLLTAATIGRFQEPEDKRRDDVSLGLWFGSILAACTPLIAVLSHRFLGVGPSLIDEFALVTVTVLMLACGYSMQLKAPALFGGGALTTYLTVLVLTLAYQPQIAMGVYLAIGGGLLFGIGVLLSLYRDRIVELPDRIARREGVFRVITWR